MPAKLPPLPTVDVIVHVPIYNQQIGVLHKPADLDAWIEEANPRDDTADGRLANASVYYFIREDGTPVIAACLPKGTPAHTLAHEAVHAAWRVLDIAGVGLGVDDHEPLAYLVQFLFDEFTRVCGRARRKPRA